MAVLRKGNVVMDDFVTRNMLRKGNVFPFTRLECNCKYRSRNQSCSAGNVASIFEICLKHQHQFLRVLREKTLEFFLADYSCSQPEVSTTFWLFKKYTGTGSFLY